jgi:hypothetical protein
MFGGGRVRGWGGYLLWWREVPSVDGRRCGCMSRGVPCWVVWTGEDIGAGGVVGRCGGVVCGRVVGVDISGFLKKNIARSNLCREERIHCQIRVAKNVVS